MYQVTVTGEEFQSFLAAVRAAGPLRSNVVEVDTGTIRWTPAPPVDRKRMRYYRERVAAYAAQESNN